VCSNHLGFAGLELLRMVDDEAIGRDEFPDPRAFIVLGILMRPIFHHPQWNREKSLRRSSQTIIGPTLVGRAPPQPEENPDRYVPAINRSARITSDAQTNFANGLRAYDFDLAALAWLLHRLLMIITTAWTIYVLYAREFKPNTLEPMMAQDRSPALRP
jgi:hypothetical protein